MAKQSNLTPARIHELQTSQKLTLEEIGKIYGLTKGGVSYIKRQGGRQFRTPREAAMENFPWPDMDKQFKDSQPYSRVTNHLEYVQTGGRGMKDWKLKLLAGWYQRFTDYNVILEFNPEFKPTPGIKSGGWLYVPRQPEDGDLLIRENEHTILKDEAREIWRIPEIRPSV